MRTTIPCNTIRTASAILLVIGLLALESLGAPDPASEVFTSININGHLGGGWPTSYGYTLNGPTTVTSPDHYRATDPLITSPGSLDGEGVAAFGTLKSRVHIEGPAAMLGNSNSLWNDHWTVINPPLTGTTGTMQLAFDLSGTATILDINSKPVATDEYTSLSLIVDLNPSSISNGIRLLAFHTSLDPGLTQITATPNGPTVTDRFNFTYGTQFRVRTILTVHAQTDNAYLWTDFDPFFAHYGGGNIGSVTVDFMNALNAAELTVIVIPDDPDATVVGAETDYSDLVKPDVPLPASLWLILGGLPVLARTRRRR